MRNITSGESISASHGGSSDIYLGKCLSDSLPIYHQFYVFEEMFAIGQPVGYLLIGEGYGLFFHDKLLRNDETTIMGLSIFSRTIYMYFMSTFTCNGLRKVKSVVVSSVIALVDNERNIQKLEKSNKMETGLAGVTCQG